VPEGSPPLPPRKPGPISGFRPGMRWAGIPNPYRFMFGISGFPPAQEI